MQIDITPAFLVWLCAGLVATLVAAGLIIAKMYNERILAQIRECQSTMIKLIDDDRADCMRRDSDYVHAAEKIHVKLEQAVTYAHVRINDIAEARALRKTVLTKEFRADAGHPA